MSSNNLLLKDTSIKFNVNPVDMKYIHYIISYEALQFNIGTIHTSASVTNNTAHLFKVKATSHTYTLEISTNTLLNCNCYESDIFNLKF